MFSSNSSSSFTSTTSSKKIQKENSGTQGSSVTKRLQNELMSLMMSQDKGISAFPDETNLFSWTGVINGVDGTPYEKQTYRLQMTFSPQYPYTAPTVRFETNCFHPNVDQNGNICLDILKEKWSAVYNVRTILLSIQALLGEPNIDSPFNGYAAALWASQEEFRAAVLKFYNGAK